MEDVVYDDDDYDDPSDFEMYEDDSVYWDDSGLMGIDHRSMGIDHGSMSMRQLIQICVQPTLSDAFPSIGKLMVSCFLLRSVVSLVPLPAVLVHLSSVISGLFALWLFTNNKMGYVIILGFLAYSCLFTVHQTLKKHYGAFCAVITVLFLVICEVYIVESKEWHVIRGIQMILAMKVISLGFDLDNRQVSRLPRPVEFGGYCLCAGTVIFGPWLSYKEYTRSLLNRMQFTFPWILRIFLSGALSVVCLLLSTCFSQWMIPEFSNKWLIAYRDALSFRASHYFISFISEATSLSVGLGSLERNRWDLFVSHPHKIEFPRSLTEVVIYWNMPMHHWLKTYVFKIFKPLNTFSGIVSTYAASSLLHGLNFQLAAVLLSLGFYTYVEYLFRQKLAAIFSACILARKCRSECVHAYKQSHPLVFLTNLCFGCLSAFHLAYLGVMFDNSSSIHDQGYNMEHTLSKWRELNFASHWIILGCYITHVLI